MFWSNNDDDVRELKHKPNHWGVVYTCADVMDTAPCKKRQRFTLTVDEPQREGFGFERELLQMCSWKERSLGGVSRDFMPPRPSEVRAMVALQRKPPVVCAVPMDE